MRSYFLKIFLLVTIVFSAFSLKATHNRAGEIIYERITGLTYRVTIITYTVESSNADRPELQLFWGDGDSEIVLRSNGPLNIDGEYQGAFIGNDIKRNEYVATHTYSGPATYKLYFEDENRNGGVINIPSSINQAFYVESEIVIDPFAGENISPQLLYPPIDDACVGELFIHNPGAWDADGDSLTYTLVDCRGAGGNEIAGYFVPAGVELDINTGSLTWTPPLLGEYNFAILIEEWRDGVLMGSILRDLQVTVQNCTNEPPIISVSSPHCLIAGDSLSFGVFASDVDVIQEISLSSVSGLYDLSVSPAEFNNAQGFSFVNSVFTWQSECSHIRNSPYTVLFTATDNGTPVNLSAQSISEIQVVAPAVSIDTIIPQGINPVLHWSHAECQSLTGYKIYKGDYYNFQPDPCETGVPAYTGYDLIGTSLPADTSYTDVLDEDVLDDRSCYIVVACYEDGSESMASNEYCFEFTKSVPVITHVSVLKTHADSGRVLLQWSTPLEIDSLLTPGPFEYQLIRRDEQGVETNVYQSSVLTDTMFVDSMLNTEAEKYTYRVDFYNQTPGNEFLIGSSRLARSLFLNIDETDHTLILSWEESVPWTNTLYRIYQESPIDSDNYILVDSTYNDTLTIDTLQNLERYCYRIESEGEYLASYLPSPLLNFSQKQCGSPLDTIPPCPPSFLVDHSCDQYYNELTWTADTSCNQDVGSYHVYYKPFLDSDFERIETLEVTGDLTYLHGNLSSVAGCYFIAGVDTFDNETPIVGDGQCFDNCPDYTLPNVVTMNGDGVNDNFIPISYDFVDRIEISIFNRWGEKVYEHNGGPDFSWDGTEMKQGNRVSDGVYYYVCEVYEIRLSGIEQRQITGYLHIIENQAANIRE